jgi:hypothetical protein
MPMSQETLVYNGPLPTAAGRGGPVSHFSGFEDKALRKTAVHSIR